MGFPTGSDRPRQAVTRLQSLLSATVVIAILSIFAASAMLGASPAVAQESEDDTALASASVTPEDALAYVTFTLDEESEQWTRAAELLESAGLGDAIDNLRDELLSSANADQLPLDAFLGGHGALIVTDAAIAAATDAAGGLTGGLGEDGLAETPAADGVPEARGVAFVLDARAPDTAYLGIVGAVEDQAEEAGTEVATTDYEGVEIQYAPANGDDSPFAVARLDNDLILVGTSPTDFESVIDANAGSIAALADAAPFTELRETLSGEFLLYGFINGVAAAQAQAAAGGDQLGLGSLGTEVSGLDQYTALLVRADDSGFRMETATVAGEGAQLPPSAPNFDSTMLGQTPGDALFFMNATELGQTGVLDALGLVVLLAAGGQMGAGIATPAPEMSQEDFIAQQYEQAAALIGFNLQTEFFRQLVGEYGLWIASGEDPASIRGLFASGVEEPGTVVNALSQLTLLVQGALGGQASVTTRDVEGSDVNVVETADPAVPDVEYGVVGDQLLIGVGEAIDTFVGGPDETLADNEQYQTVMATLPEETNGQLYVDLGQIIPLLQAMQSSGAGDDFTIEDASEECAEYATQEEAQAAYDEDTFANSALDQDFDGEACEDFFAADVATPADGALEADYSAVKAFGLAAYDEDGMRRSSSILFIEEE